MLARAAGPGGVSSLAETWALACSPTTFSPTVVRGFACFLGGVMSATNSVDFGFLAACGRKVVRFRDRCRVLLIDSWRCLACFRSF